MKKDKGSDEMQVLLYVSATIIAVAFAVLVIYACRTLLSLQKTLENVASTLEGIRKANARNKRRNRAVIT